MKAKQLLKLLPRKKAYAAELKRIDREIKALSRRRDRLDRELHAISQVTEVYEGQPLSVWRGTTCSLYVSSPAGGNERRAEAHEDAHHPGSGRWVASKEGWDGGPHFIVFNLTRKRAVEIAKRWVAFGERPAEADK